ncbi:MAG TPA: site-2 protease family protein [Candidatus Hydrogenedentes bacterium]|nr:MAG: Peptidase family M50 [Candidatus Hydrogenedentes bacterium ADurb.Bin170]HNZ49259.1 site-2 protease family protein [Candidatus Hydrogenedentota bacterium]HOD96368.1 site-2 protease family protein [Candidatus Hydrogenedentota bacterium]HOH42991.1 site-2 protease family protein [Candidatus Hydrogenedentota bacterium]HOM49413.1 site-2 protease family protein [Candidatus Hydrogenedentota bacterium]
MSETVSIILLQYLCLLFSLSVHEGAHAAMANYWGDPTARLMGRMSLNPIKHADIMGTVILPLFAMITGWRFMFGWAKPVPYNPRNLRDRKKGPVFIALAGPGSNLLVVFAAVAVLRGLALLPESDTATLFMRALFYLVMINSLLLLFNLIPIPPLDGHHVVEFFLPYEWKKKFEQIGPYSIFILFFLIFYLNILRVPMAFVLRGTLTLAFYGTPVWGERILSIIGG